MRACRHCEAECRQVFCSARCRKRAKRRRDAGLPENAYPHGGLRGRVRLGELTEKERAWAVIADALARR